MSFQPFNNQKEIWKSGPFVRRTFYRTDGTGRDSYINRNNGNFVEDRDFNVHPISGRYLKQCQNPPRVIQPAQAKRSVFYYCDGSGRDNYVQTNSGGMMGDWSLKQQTRNLFLKSLRNTETNFDQIPKQPLYNPQLAHSQKYLNEKLSKPKRSESKYETEVKKQSVRIRTNSEYHPFPLLDKSKTTDFKYV